MAGKTGVIYNTNDDSVVLKCPITPQQCDCTPTCAKPGLSDWGYWLWHWAIIHFTTDTWASLTFSLLWMIIRVELTKGILHNKMISNCIKTVQILQSSPLVVVKKVVSECVLRASVARTCQQVTSYNTSGLSSKQIILAINIVSILVVQL